MSRELKKDRIRLGITAVSSPLEVGANQAPSLLDQLQQAFGKGRYDRLEIYRSPKPVTDPASAAASRYFYDQRVDTICVVAAC